MVNSARINQHRLKEILINIYVSGMESEDIHVREFIEEIKKQLLADTR